MCFKKKTTNNNESDLWFLGKFGQEFERTAHKGSPALSTHTKERKKEKKKRKKESKTERKIKKKQTSKLTNK